MDTDYIGSWMDEVKDVNVKEVLDTYYFVLESPLEYEFTPNDVLSRGSEILGMSVEELLSWVSIHKFNSSLELKIK